MSDIFDLVEAFFIPQRAIGTFTTQVTIEEVGEDTAEVTEFPVQSGATISDHVILKTPTLIIQAMWDDFDIPLAQTYQNLLLLMTNKIPFDVITGKRAYSNMVMTSLNQTTDRSTENILSIRMSLKQINIVNISVVSVPPRSQQSEPQTTGAVENAGQKNAQEATQNEKQSALSVLAS